MPEQTSKTNDSFTLAGREYRSRLLVGTGKYRDMEETRLAIEASGAEIVTTPPDDGTSWLGWLPMLLIIVFWVWMI